MYRRVKDITSHCRDNGARKCSRIASLSYPITFLAKIAIALNQFYLDLFPEFYDKPGEMVRGLRVEEMITSESLNISRSYDHFYLKRNYLFNLKYGT
jgi:hypothetical protein